MADVEKKRQDIDMQREGYLYSHDRRRMARGKTTSLSHSGAEAGGGR